MVYITKYLIKLFNICNNLTSTTSLLKSYINYGHYYKVQPTVIQQSVSWHGLIQCICIIRRYVFIEPSGDGFNTLTATYIAGRINALLFVLTGDLNALLMNGNTSGTNVLLFDGSCGG